MLVGYMHNYKKPTSLVNIIALIAKAKGIDFVYFNSSGVDLNTKKIVGHTLVDNKWRKIKTRMPSIIDVNAYALKYKSEILHLAKHSYLTDNGTNRLTTEIILNELKKDSELKKYVPTSIVCSSFSDIKEFLALYKEIIISPIDKNSEQNAYYIISNTSSGNTTTYIVKNNTIHSKITLDKLQALYNQDISGMNYVVQQFISSKTKNGDPFDCRIHLEKNRRGNWVIAKNYIRIGLHENANSILKQDNSSGIAEADVFFKANYPESAKEIIEKLNNLGKEIALKVEEMRGIKLSTLGIDVAIDNSGNLFISKITSAPAPSILSSEIALLRTDYYQYLYDNKTRG